MLITLTKATNVEHINFSSFLVKFINVCKKSTQIKEIFEEAIAIKSVFDLLWIFIGNPFATYQYFFIFKLNFTLLLVLSTPLSLRFTLHTTMIYLLELRWPPVTHYFYPRSKDQIHNFKHPGPLQSLPRCCQNMWTSRSTLF